MKITDIAYEKLLERSKKEGNKYFRLALIPNGCAGFEYDFDFAHDISSSALHEHWTVHEKELIFYIEPLSYAYLSTVVLDYQTNGLNEEFKFVNPQETIACGCGQSVGF
jgi:iron-sulfur cluster assembly accessory protein